MVLTASCSLSRTVSSAKTVLPKTDLVLADLDIQTNKVTGEYRYDIQKDLQKTVDKEGYNAIVVAFGDVKEKNVNIILLYLMIKLKNYNT